MDQLNKVYSHSGTQMEESVDLILEKLKHAVGPVIDLIENETPEVRAIFVVGAKELIVDGEYTGVQTFIDICGDYGILGEAIYGELIASIQDKKPQLFHMLRDVIKTIEEELDLDVDTPLDSTRVLH